MFESYLTISVDIYNESTKLDTLDISIKVINENSFEEAKEAMWSAAEEAKLEWFSEKGITDEDREEEYYHLENMKIEM